MNDITDWDDDIVDQEVTDEEFIEFNKGFICSAELS